MKQRYNKMKLFQQVRVNFNFNKVTGEAFNTNLLSSLEGLAIFAKKKVKETFKTERDITGKKYAPSTYKYLAIKHDHNESKIKNNKIMTDTGELERSINYGIDEANLASAVGTELEKYEQHLESKVSGVIRDDKSYKGYMGDFAKVPQRKFFFTSDDEAFEIMEKKIDAEINGFFKEFIRNLSTSMRKLVE